MKVIKVTSAQNGHLQHPLNRTIDVMKQHKCGGISKTGEGIVEINPWSKEIGQAIKESLTQLKIKFVEES